MFGDDLAGTTCSVKFLDPKDVLRLRHPAIPVLRDQAGDIFRSIHPNPPSADSAINAAGSAC
jgi:hypothetical protein